MSVAVQPINKNAVLRIPEFRYLMLSRAISAFAGSGLATALGYQVYHLTNDPLSLGWLGLIEAIPAIALSLLGGHIADRLDRKRVVLITATISAFCILLLGIFAAMPDRFGILSIYLAAFLFGLANGFYRPASTAFEQQAIPLEYAAVGSSWLSSVWLGAALVGAPMTGFAIDTFGLSNTYLIISALSLLAVLALALIPRQPVIPAEAGETLGKSLRAGVSFVLKSQPLIGSMALDLFAVLFGGAMALLPVFAKDILHVDATGLGWLRTAPSAGALLVMLWTTRFPPTARAGRNLLLSVAAFGVSFIIFGLSTNFWLSMVALFFSGLFDGISMVIRNVIGRVLTPDEMRGRVAAVTWVFIGASNEIGAFESGVAAKLLGTAPAVYWGGAVTLVVVALVAVTMPKLRDLKL